MKFQRCWNGVRRLGSGPSLANIAKLDAGAIPMIAHMMQRGLRVDLDHFATMEKTLTDDMERIEAEVQQVAGRYINLDSGDQVSHLLFKQMGIQQARRKFTPGGSRESVENEVLVAIQHVHPVIPKILNFKELSKLRGTYVVPMPRLAKKVGFGHWRMFPYFNTTRVPSGRLSCKDPNLLAMPSRTERGREIRKGFITDPGWVFVSVDESQIEMRVAANESGDEALCHIYETQQDIYSDFATSAFHLKDERHQDAEGKWQYPTVDRMAHRYPAKTCVLAAIYRVTAVGLLEQMPVICERCHREAAKHDESCRGFVSVWTEEKCQDILNAFYLSYPGLTRMQTEHDRRARRNGYTWDMWGRLLQLAAVRSIHPWVVSAALREGGNFPIQCLHPASKVVRRGVGAVEIGSLSGTVELWDGNEWASGTVVTTPPKEQLRVVLKDGLRLTCSPEHPILIVSVKGIQKWVRAGDLESIDLKNHKVVSTGGIEEEWDWGQIIPPCPPKKRPSENGYDLSWVSSNQKQFGEFVGRVASDGSVLSYPDGRSRNVRLLVAQHEEVILPGLLETANRICKASHRTEQKQGYAPMHRVDIYSHHLTALLKSWDLKGGIPPIMWSSSTLLQSYLRGMFDGDGTVSPDNVILTFGAGNGRLPLARSIQFALSSLGIRSRLRIYDRSIRLAIQKRDTWRFYSRVGFINPRKNEEIIYKIRPQTKSRPYYGRSTSVDWIDHLPGRVPMVDFVNSSTGRFMAEGLIVHNSGAQGTVKLTMAEVMDDLTDGGMLEVVHPLLQIHDELLFCARADVADELADHVKHRFENCVRLRVPIQASAAKALTWGDLEK